MDEIIAELARNPFVSEVEVINRVDEPELQVENVQPSKHPTISAVIRHITERLSATQA